MKLSERTKKGLRKKSRNGRQNMANRRRKRNLGKIAKPFQNQKKKKELKKARPKTKKRAFPRQKKRKLARKMRRRPRR